MISEGEQMKKGEKNESRETQEDSEHSWQHPKEWKEDSQIARIPNTESQDG